MNLLRNKRLWLTVGVSALALMSENFITTHADTIKSNQNNSTVQQTNINQQTNNQVIPNQQMRLGSEQNNQQKQNLAPYGDDYNWIAISDGESVQGYTNSKSVHDWQTNEQLDKPSLDGLNWRYSNQTKALEMTNGTFTGNSDFNYDMNNVIPGSNTDIHSLKFDKGIGTDNLTSLGGFIYQNTINSLDLSGLNASQVTDTNQPFDESPLHNLVLPQNLNFNQCGQYKDLWAEQSSTYGINSFTISPGDTVNSSDPSFSNYLQGSQWYRKANNSNLVKDSINNQSTALPQGTYVNHAFNDFTSPGGSEYTVNDTGLAPENIPQEILDLNQKSKPVQKFQPIIQKQNHSNVVNKNNNSVVNNNPIKQVIYKKPNTVQFKRNKKLNLNQIIKELPYFRINQHTNLKGTTIQRKAIGKLRYIRILKPVLLHFNPISVGSKSFADMGIRPKQLLTLTIHGIYKFHKNNDTWYRYLINYHHRYYFITANPKYVRNAYLRPTKRSSKVKILHNVKLYQKYNHKYIKTIKHGKTIKFKKVQRQGKYNRAILKLRNGDWTTANLNFIKLI